MDQDWTKQAAIQAADAKMAEAIALMREAKAIYFNADQDVRSLTTGEAIEYAEEASA